jgi:undecaprenyl-diphosphatase
MGQSRARVRAINHVAECISDRRANQRHWVAIAIGLTIFVAIALAVRLGVTDGWDRWVLLAMRRPGDLSMAGPRWLREAAVDVTALGSTTIVLLVVVTAAMFLAFNRRAREAVMISGCAGSGYVLMQLLKAGFDRPRPEVVPHAILATGASFPSGHAMLSAFTYLTLAGIITRGRHPRSMRILLWWIAAMLVVMIGSTRVYFGVHWPTDVLAGWIAGGVWAALWARRSGSL